ncbi:DUF3943 domain-containing protein [Halobacteriovorax sp. GB3]|uniref:DUF3943 domain-containing protein n=1 Tax=Halobacteriovorax sp. GB3 TaxID=2719615 RepID=UPI00235F849A|nr:DUF3943 domain-containing protein [Halobacteriovorax sp. GB3]MDD0853323.1 DUF3943 domain-containing protein [Halobacteriovorax sp. GB3]
MKVKALLAGLLLAQSITGFSADLDFKFGSKEHLQELEKQRQIKEQREWMFNPMSSFVSKEKWEEINDNIQQENEQKRKFSQGRVITIDTRDQKACRAIQEELENKGQALAQTQSMCDLDKENPYSSVIIVDGEQRRPIEFGDMNPKTKTMLRQTRNFSVLGAGMIGFLYLLPESVTNWDKDEMNNLGNKYKENIKEGPVQDKDHWAINYIGHSYSGAIYYVVARHAGLNQMQSFGYSVLMSTFFWEYGLEAFAEVPSIQDLLITPILGSLLGEAFIKWEEKIKDNKGELLGSKKLGSVALGLMDPAGALLDSVNGLFEAEIFKEANTHWFYNPGQQFYDGQNNHSEPVIGVRFELKF